MKTTPIGKAIILICIPLMAPFFILGFVGNMMFVSFLMGKVYFEKFVDWL